MLRWLLMRAYRVPDRPAPPDPTTLGLVAEDLDLRAVDSSRLRGWFVPPPTTPSTDRANRYPAVVLVHGWGSSSGDLLPAVPALVDAGFGVALLDARSHGRSDRVEFMSMPRFAEDVEVVLTWLRDDPRIDPDRIVLVGHSVGAGASLLVGSRDPRVRAIVSIASMAHPAELIERTLGGRQLPSVAMAAARRTVEATIGARLDDIAPLSTIGRVTAPVLLLHGLDDTTVPALDAMRLADRAAATGGTVSLRLIPGADHRTIDAFLPATTEAARFLVAAVDGDVRKVPPAADRASGPVVA